ncbi:MAG: ABC transporter permease [Pseudomonadota bacterium]
MHPTEYKIGPNQFSAAIRDIAAGVRQWRLSIALTSEDIRIRFKRTQIGILWTTLSFMLFVWVKVLIFTPFVTVDPTYFTNYVAINYFVWMFVSAVLSDGCQVFVNAERWLKGGRFPLSVFVNVSMMRSTVFSAFNFAVIVIMFIIYKIAVTPAAVVSLFVFLLLLISGYSVHFVLGAICARFRDVSHLVQAILRVMFFLTPIFWMPDQIGALWRYLQFNPFAHYLIAFREPLLSGEVPMLSLYVVAGCSLSLVFASLIALVVARRRIVFWL